MMQVSLCKLPVTSSPALLNFYSEMVMQLGKLNEAVRHVPDLQCFLRSFVIRKVAPELAPNKIHATLQQLTHLMADLKSYIKTDMAMPLLVECRLPSCGRMLIVLMLVESKLIPMPILYPSLYFKRHHQEYYRRLDAVREQGDFEGWITYFLQAIQASSLDAYQRAKDIEQLERELFDQVQKDTRFAKMRETSIETIKIMFQLPIISTTELAQQLGKTFNAASKVIALLIEAGILQPAASGKSRSALFCFAPYMRLLEREYVSMGQ